MFKIYDLNLNEIPFPEGVKPLDIIVGSISKKRETEEISGRPGVMNYGFNYESRPVDISLWAEAYDMTDYRLIRNDIYAFFDSHDEFYIAETRVPSRVLKVTIDESYTPERLTHIHAQVDISLRTVDSVFWESIYTTLELHDSKYSSNPDKYGLVDNIDDEKIRYRFEERIFNVYNAGNVTIRPEDMRLIIQLRFASSDGNLTLRNRTTGEEFKLNSSINQKNIRLSGMNILDGTTNAFRDSNRRLISLKPGMNQFEITGATFDQIWFDFKYLYK